MDCIYNYVSTHVMLIGFLLGWVLDMLFGDPITLPHPIVYMGKWVAMWEHRLNNGNNRKAKGALMATGSIALMFAAAWIVFRFLLWTETEMEQTAWGAVALGLRLGLTAVLVFFCLAGHTLRKEVRMVFEALERNLDDGRKQVARIVGRDTQELSQGEVQAAALETLAENLSDGVVAPVFWFCLLGVPGMLAYKMVNTLDSMVGYQNARYKDYGCWAAHIDDVFNYIPARITALLMTVCGWAYVRIKGVKDCGRSLISLLRFTLKYANCHASPNSGWPEAALAGLLDCRFGGTHNYFGEVFYKPYIGVTPRQLTFSDMQTSIMVCFITEFACVVTVALLFL